MFVSVASCPGGAAALARGLRAARASSDSVTPSGLAAGARLVRDGEVFRAALAVAGDRAAAPLARGAAFYILAALGKGGLVGVPYAAFRRTTLAAAARARAGGAPDTADIGNLLTRPLLYATGPDSRHDGEAPLPADYRQRAGALVARVAEDPSEPADARALAACAL
ncbi:MAG: hypothetical protein ACJ79S_22440 [Gemmatimonadaceae bacterium]